MSVALFALAIGGPVALLIKHVFDQLRMEAYVQLRIDADDLTTRVDRRTQEVLAEEEARKFEEFTFLNVIGKKNTFLQLSPLSRFPVETRLPGLVGYFQLDPDGGFSSPLLPRETDLESVVDRFGIDDAEFRQRRDREKQVLTILQKNDIAKATGPQATKLAEEQLEKTKSYLKPSSKESQGEDLKDMAQEAAPQAPYEELEIASSQSTFAGINQRQKKMGEMKIRKGESRKEQVSIPDATTNDGLGATTAKTAIKTFEGEVDPFQFGMLTSGHPVLYRKVWREGRRYIQGAIMEQRAFIDAFVGNLYHDSALSSAVTVSVLRGAETIATYAPDGLGNGSRTLIAKQALSAPFDYLHLVFSVDRLVSGPSVRYAVTISGFLITVLIAGILAIFLAGRRQIALSQQQRDFVSAVSHELKTPLTSIRMYSEMLREGWATEDKKRGYYDFIFSESERLSRLIANVLQLARLSRGQELACLSMPVSEAYRRVSEVISTQVSGAGFTKKDLAPAGGVDPTLHVDVDALTQVFVNLVDNGIKFSAKTDRKEIVIGYEISPVGTEVRFFVRDFGPGIPRDQLKRIFKLFYRPENELTRTTKGTGIGLALVHDLTAKMGGRVDVESQPGLTEFRVILPAVASIARHKEP